MLKLIFIIIFSIVLFKGNTQNLLVFENLKNGKIEAYKLPIKAMCKFKDGTKKIIVIDSIQGDSLYCKLRNNKNCFSLSSIKKINNFNSEMNKLTLDLGIASFGTIILVGATSFAIYYQENLSSGPGDNTFITLALLGSPFTAAFLLTETYLIIKYLYKVSLDDWKFYGIQVR